MSSLLPLFGWTIAAGALMAAGLALIGAQLSARRQSAQTLVVAQASSLGVVAGLAMIHLLGLEEEQLPIIPLVTAFLTAGGVYLLCEKRVPATVPSRNSYYIGFFALLLSLTYLVTALVPGLESHRAATYFGDLALVSEREAKIAVGLAALALGLLAYSWLTISSLSFDLAIFEGSPWPPRKRRANIFFVAGSLALICLSIQSMGLLFTLAALFLPSLPVSTRARSLGRFTALVVIIAILGATCGFFVSLWQGSLPTVPAITVGFVVWGIIVRFGLRFI